MIDEAEKRTIKEISEKYNVRKVLLFGSGAAPGGENRDIDIGIEGIEPSRFFDYYGELMLSLSKSVDVVDLSEKSKFASLVEREGIRIHG